jgi:putative NADH-flavin reductase
VIAPGERTGAYKTGADSPAGESISAEDYAVALLDEIEKPAHHCRSDNQPAGARRAASSVLG